MKNLLLFLFFSISQQIFSQNTDFTYLYKGTIDSKIAITLYLHTTTNTCDGSNRYDAMYKYDNSNKWIQLNVSNNDSEKNFCLVEQNFSGVMILTKMPKTFSGKWINPNGDKQLKVIINLQILSSKTKKKLEEKFEKLNYENNDC